MHLGIGQQLFKGYIRPQVDMQSQANRNEQMKLSQDTSSISTLAEISYTKA
jgi:hypothetical protein